MKYATRKLVKPGDLNANNTLFGGALLRWIDEEAGIYAMSKVNDQKVVTKFMSEIDFISTAKQGDIVEIGLALKEVGITSLTFTCHVRNLLTKESILSIDKIVMVRVDHSGKPFAHDYDTEKDKYLVL